MGNTIEDNNFRRRFRARLNKLSGFYLRDEDKFVIEFIATNPEIIKEIVRCRLRVEEYRGSKIADLVEYASEVLYYYEACYKKYIKLKEKKLAEEATIKARKQKSFTLHNPKDLERFEGFLDTMLTLLDLNEDLFVQTLPKCPVELWDKIDDLRETSFKEDRDSPEYTRCLKKCKKISLTYFKLSNPKFNWEDSEVY